MDYPLELVLKHPLVRLTPAKEGNKTVIVGKVFVNNQDYPVLLEQATSADGTLIINILDSEKTVSKNIYTKVKRTFRKKKFKSTLEALDDICDIIQQENPVKVIENTCDIYRKVLTEYTEFTKFFLNLKYCELKEDLTSIAVCVSDSKLRDHKVNISVDYSRKSPNLFRVSEFDLPQNNQESFEGDNLISLFDQFFGRVELLQPYFDLMEELDKNATVLDPEAPKWKDSYRNVWLGENCSTIITVDPFNVFHRPNIRFLGPDRLVAPYIAHLNRNLDSWIYQENIFQGILDLLALDEFPKKAKTCRQSNLLVEFGECSICFSLRLNDKLPEIICKNKSCEKYYHNECLYNWFVSLNARRIFNSISGSCPNCEKTISCSVLY